jgi:hypothetical protein
MELCRFHLESRCCKGASCPYAHVPHFQRGGPSRPVTQTQAIEYKTPCKYYLGGGCRTGDVCAYSHAAMDDPAAKKIRHANEPTSTDSRSRVPCKYHLNGGCKNGRNCEYSHFSVDRSDEGFGPAEDVGAMSTTTSNFLLTNHTSYN